MSKDGTPTKPQEQTISEADQARALLQAERQGRIAACQTAIAQALREHRCSLDLAMEIRAGGIIPKLNLIAED